MQLRKQAKAFKFLIIHTTFSNTCSANTFIQHHPTINEGVSGHH